MKALILNSGLGHRMGVLTSEQPKCMTELNNNETILGRQLKILSMLGIKDVVMTTGYHKEVLIEYCNSLHLPIKMQFVYNSLYAETNYIYSIYCARAYLNDDIVIMHGDLVFEISVLEDLIACKDSCMKVSSTMSLPDKDFKAVVHDGHIDKVGIEFFDDAMEAQPLYKLNKVDWQIWLSEIISFCESGDEAKRKCYAENAFNCVSNKCNIRAFDVQNRLCSEIDTPEDLKRVLAKLDEIENRYDAV